MRSNKDIDQKKKKLLGEFTHDDKTWQGYELTNVEGKGLFLGLLFGTTAFLCIVGFLAWYVPTIGFENIHPSLPLLFAGVLLSIGLFIVISGGLIIHAINSGDHVSGARLIRFLLIKFFYPLVEMLSKMLGIDKIKIEKVFVELNNRIVRSMGLDLRPDKLMLLMPHCIQYEDCKMKVTRDVKECKGCGICEVGELLELSEDYGIDLFIATGGTVARREIEKKRPNAIVAVACERDLSSGIQDAYPLPVLSLVNKRPYGYCANTGVSIPDVKAAIKDFLGEPVIKEGEDVKEEKEFTPKTEDLSHLSKNKKSA